MMQGTVTTFDATHGYGFITVDGLDYAVFVHASAIATPFVPALRVGQRVAFDLVTDLQAPRAVNVILVRRSGCTIPRHRGPLGAVSRGQRRPGSGQSPDPPLRRGLPRSVRGAVRETADLGHQTAARTGDPSALSRVLDAPVTTVWEVWTQPQHFARWLNLDLSSIRLDMRPGGSWRATMVYPDGTERPMSGSYGEVVQHRRLVVTLHVPGCAESTLFDTSFTDLGSQTRVTLDLTRLSDEERERVRVGVEAFLAGFSAYLASV